MTLDKDTKQMNSLHQEKESEFRVKPYLSAFIEAIIQEFAHVENTSRDI